MKVWVASVEIPLFSEHPTGPQFDSVIGVFTSPERAILALEDEITGYVTWDRDEDGFIEGVGEALYYGENLVSDKGIWIERFELNEIERASNIITAEEQQSG